MSVHVAIFICYDNVIRNRFSEYEKFDSHSTL